VKERGVNNKQVLALIGLAASILGVVRALRQVREAFSENSEDKRS
jgi:hypothetical protein